MNFSEKDYLDVARSRITWQFKESDNLDTLMRIWLEGYQGVQKTLLQVRLINEIDTATGVQLDVIGDIVGQPRVILDISSTGFFGFSQDSGAKPYGSLKNGQGGLWYSLRDPDSGNIELSDDLYRLFIKAKIRNNNTGSTPEEVIAATKDIFQTDYVELLEGDYAQFYLYPGRPWNDDSETVYPGLDETAIANRLLPKPIGVEVVYSNVSIIESTEAAQAFSSAADRLYFTANTVIPTNFAH